jgi:FkbM family methyltransferase
MKPVASVRKISSFLGSSRDLGRPNWKGFPGIPKSWSMSTPYNRENYNTFVSWIRLLGLKGLNCVVDVGANHGDFSLAATAHNPAARILLFEPLPSLQSELECRGRPFPGWQIDRRALGEVESTMDLQLVEGQDDIGTLAAFSESYIEATGTAQTRIYTTPCKVTTLDIALNQHKIEKVDLLKIDVEGYEFELLAGATRCLQFVDSIIIEISYIRKDFTVTDPLVDLLRILTPYGFRVIRIFPSLYSRKQSWLPLEYNVLLRKAEQVA